MAMERGEGRQEGEFIKLIKQVKKKIEKSIPEERCANMLEEDIAVIGKIYDIIKNHPDWEDIRVYETVEGLFLPILPDIMVTILRRLGNSLFLGELLWRLPLCCQTRRAGWVRPHRPMCLQHR